MEEQEKIVDKQSKGEKRLTKMDSWKSGESRCCKKSAPSKHICKRAGFEGQLKESEREEDNKTGFAISFL